MKFRLSVLALLAAAALLPACAPLVLGGAAVGGAMFAADRRTSGAQVEDQSLEYKAVARMKELNSLGNVSATSFNRLLLITGQVPTEADRVALGEAVAKLENVRAVVNELAVVGNTTFGASSNDAIISAKVIGAFIDARDLQSNAFKVVTERGVVYLMGIVTEREASRAAELARTVGGVQKVVRVFEVISEEELARLLPKPAPK
jgi:osmotically-inducible protein OsmY